MNLGKKRALASKALHVGKNKIYFSPESLSDIKEAITKQDILTLFQEGVIKVKPANGRRKVEKRRTRRGSGKIKMKVRHRKRDYVRLTRKLRKYLISLKNSGKISKENYWSLRNKIRMSSFKDSGHFKEYINELNSQKNIKIKDKKTIGGQHETKQEKKNRK